MSPPDGGLVFSDFQGKEGMHMWGMILGTALALALAAVVYLAVCFHRFSFIRGLERKSRLLSWGAALLPLALLGLFALINVTALIVVLLHLMAAFLLCALAAFLIRKLGGRDLPYDLRGAAAIVLTAVYLGVGWYMAHHVFETDYRLESTKLKNDVRVVLLADAHLGITLDGADFAREMERVQALAPDAVVLVGDFVDDDSSREDMLAASRALGELKTTYGVYFVYGNHDEGYYRFRNFDGAELRAELEKNGVIVLEDESVPLGDDLVLIGRRDRSDRSRASIAALTEGLDPDLFTLVLDHQPNDYAAEAEAGVDLVLSGHTHGGHVFPAGQIGLLMGANDALYGLERRGGTDFIVTSGISGWAIPFKTGCRSEFAVIDLAAG